MNLHILMLGLLLVLAAPAALAYDDYDAEEELVWVAPDGVFALYCQRPGEEALFDFRVDTVMEEILSPDNAVLLTLNSEQIIIRQDNSAGTYTDYHFNMLTGQMRMEIFNGETATAIVHGLDEQPYYCVQEEMRF